MTDAFIRVPQPIEGAKVDNALVRDDVYRHRRRKLAAFLLMVA